MLAETATDTFPVTLILSLGSVVFPVIFGFVMWKMSQAFVGKEDFAAYKLQEKEDRIEHRTQLREEMMSLRRSTETINENLSKLLQRTAHMKVKDE